MARTVLVIDDSSAFRTTARMLWAARGYEVVGVAGDIATGKSWTYSVKAEGMFGYFCTYHPTMKGTLRIR